VLKIGNGVLVEEVSGPASRAGVQSGDVILAVNNQEVNSSEEFDRLINDPSRKSAALLVKRGDDAHYVSVRLDR
jgi:serine protease Do